MTITVNITAKPAPINPAIVRKPKGFLLMCDNSVDPWHAYWRVYQYASSGDAASDINPFIYPRFNDNRMNIFDDWIVGIQYWFRIEQIDKYGNVSLKSSVVTGIWKVTEEDDTDSTAPTTPNSANLTLSQVQRRDKDGSIKTYLRGDFNTAGYSAKTRFRFAITDGTNVWYTDIKNAKFHWPAEVGLTYGVNVQAISAFDVVSGVSAPNITKLITAKTADIASPSGLAIVSAHKRNEVSWTKVNTNTYPDYMETEIYRNTVNTTPTPGSTTPYRTNKGSHIVDAAIDTTTLYYYWIAHKDTSGNYTAVSGNVSGTGLKIVTADVTAGAIGTPELADNAVTDSKKVFSSIDNLIRNPSLDDITVWNWYAASGSITLANVLIAGGLSKYKLTVTATTQVSGIRTNFNSLIPVKPGDYYQFEGVFGPLTAATGTFDLAINWWQRDVAGAESYLSTDVIPNTQFTGSTVQFKSGQIDAPVGAVKAELFVRKTSADNVGIQAYDLIFRKVITEGLTDNTAPATPNSANLTLSQIQRRDKDGPIKTYLRGVFNTTGYGNKIDYQFQVSDGTNVRDIPSKNGRFETPAEVGLTYSVTVTALSFSDVQSIASGIVTKLITAKTADIATPAGLAIASAHKRNEISWTKVNTNTYPDYSETEIYRNTVNTTPTPGTTSPYRTRKGNHMVDAALDTSTLYYYWIAHKDNSGNYTAVAGPVSGTGQKIVNNDVAGDAILPSNIKNGDSSNMCRDPQILELGNYIIVGGTGQILPLGIGNVTESDNYIFVPQTVSDIGIKETWNIPVKAGKKYYASVTIGRGGGISATYAAYVEWATYDAATDTATYLTTAPALGSFTAAAQNELADIVTAPANAKRARIAGYKTGGANTDMVFYSPIFRKASSTDLIPDDAVTEPKTDSTSPATPNSANLTLSKVQRRDKDGTIKSKLKGVFNTTGYSTKTRFQFNISDGTNLEEKRSQTGKFIFEAEVGITYSVTVQAYTFVNQPSVASSAVTLLITAKTTDIGTPTGLAINSGHKKNRLTWTTVDTNTYPDYAKTVIYRNTVNTTPTPGTTAHYDTVKGDSWTDTLIDTSTLYYYWIVHRDNTGNFTAVAGPVSGTGKRVEKPDVDTVTTPGTPSPGTLTITQGAKDTDAGDGRVSVKIVMTAASLPTNADEIQFEVDFNYPSTPEIHTFPASKGLKASFDAIVGKQYSINYRGISVFDVLGPALSSPVTITPTKKSIAPADPTSVSVNSFIGLLEVRWAQPTETDYDYTQVAIRLTAGTPANSDIIAISQSITARFPLWSTALWYVYVRHVDRSGNPSNWVAYGSQAGVSALSGTFMDDQANGSIGREAFLKNATGSTIAANATTTVSGSNLVYSDSAGTAGAAPTAGTVWRCLGQCANGASSLFRRVS